MESIAKTLAAEDEDIWMELQYFRDHSHCKEVYAKMMTDKSLEPLLNEFFGLNYTRKGPYHRWIQSPQALAISVISISTTKSMRRKFSLAHFLLFISMTLTAVNYSTTSNATVQAHNFHSHLHHP